MTEGRAHLTPEERCQIEILLKRGDSQRAIAKLLGRTPRTIREELKRTKGERGYRCLQAQTKADDRRKNASQRAKKMTLETIALIEKELTQKQWSPKQISGWLKENAILSISHERIYQHIWRNKKQGGILYKNLRHNGKKYNKRAGKTAGRGLIPRRIDIDQRPEIAAMKTRLGDWEIDTVIGAHHKGVLVTAVDRASKYTVIEIVANKTSELVTAALIKRLSAFDGKVLTITADNGKEFAEHEKITEALGATVYFAKPYHSYERGLNEHTNGLIRQYLPKGRSFEDVTPAEVDRIETLLNNRPREILNFKTPQEIFFHPPPGYFHC
jgi:IS30 family transposase